MVLDWKTQFSPNICTTQGDAVLGFSAIPIELPMAIFADLEKKNLYGNTKDLNSQSNLEKEKWA